MLVPLLVSIDAQFFFALWCALVLVNWCTLMRIVACELVHTVCNDIRQEASMCSVRRSAQVHLDNALGCTMYLYLDLDLDLGAPCTCGTEIGPV